MKKIVRKIKAKKNFGNGMSNKGEVFIEYYDKPGIFYRDSWDDYEITGVGLSIDMFEAKDEFDNFFKELKPILANKTKWFKRNLPLFIERKKELEEIINTSQEELNFINEEID